MSSNEGKEILASLEKKTLSLKQRRCMVRILVSHLMEIFGENPTSEKKINMAASLVEQFPCLKDSQGKGYEAWYSPGRRNRPATGFLEERLRNVRKKIRHDNFTRRDNPQLVNSNLVLPEPGISSERAVQLAEWLKNNIWPANQVAEYMKETAIHRAKWIRDNGTKSIEDIKREFPRLLDTPGMISQDFSVLFPDHAEKLFETWALHFKDKILQLASQEKKARELFQNIANSPPEAQGDIALRLLPVILPTPLYKSGKKMFRPSLDENIKSFIEFKHVGTNMVAFLEEAEATKPFPFVLGLGDGDLCHQAFVVFGREALQQNTLLAAVDTCFKLFYVLDIHFTKQCAPVWEFLQIVVYQLPGLEGDPDLQFLMKGGDLIKVRSESWKKTRFFQLKEDCKTMWQESSRTFKKSSKSTFCLEDIDSVRHGRQSEGLKKYTESSVEDRCFSIIFKGRHKNLDLIASSQDEAKQWVRGLDKVINRIRNLSRLENSEHWIYSCMRKADKNHDNKMTLKELKHFLRQINVDLDDRYAEMLFKTCDTSNSGTLEDSEIKQFYDLLTYREEIDEIFKKYSNGKEKMSTDDLLNFIQDEQREPVGSDYAKMIIDKYEVDGTAKQMKQMTKDGFLMYLNHEEGNLFNPAHVPVYQDMRQPLNHYFISSSHNTYLMEDQLKGPSSTEAYIKALMKSCRCVELDCWDGVNGEPVIYHGHTLTSKVLFKDVIKAIKQYAFKTSEYPVILSLETHCSVEQQKVMAWHLTSILGSALLTRPLGKQMPTSLPGPEELKGRILIKGKRLNKLDTAFNNNSTEDVDSVSEEDESAELKDEEKPKGQKTKKIKLAKELSDLVIYCKSVHFTGFENSKAKHAFYEMASFKESKAMNLVENSGTAFIRHNVDKLSRIYPAGSRTDSSNYNPVPLWNAGCQIVALNFQTGCKEMDLNQGCFLPNGRCGYILKPPFLRDPATQFDPVNLSVGPWLKKKHLHVMVISAQQLPKLNKDKQSSIVDPLVKVEVCGIPDDNAIQQTHHIDNNGFNPQWNINFKFLIYVPELALVRFMVEDYDTSSFNDFVGQYTIPLTSMQMGYRHLPLFTKRGDLIPSAGLFVHIMLLDVD